MRLATVILLREQTWVCILLSCTRIQGANDDEDRLILLLADFLPFSPFPWSVNSYQRKVNFLCSVYFFSPTLSRQWILTGYCCLIFMQIVLSLEQCVKALCLLTLSHSAREESAGSFTLYVKKWRPELSSGTCWHYCWRESFLQNCFWKWYLLGRNLSFQ